MQSTTVLALLNVRCSTNQQGKSVVSSQKSYIYRCPSGNSWQNSYFSRLSATIRQYLVKNRLFKYYLIVASDCNYLYKLYDVHNGLMKEKPLPEVSSPLVRGQFCRISINFAAYITRHFIHQMNFLQNFLQTLKQKRLALT